MDAVEFLKERKRLCQMYDVCGGCPANRISGGCIFSVSNGATPEEQAEIVETWSAAHPRKTRQSVFLEQYPNARFEANGIVNIWPCDVEKNMENVTFCNSLSCADCRREFWMQEVEQRRGE